MSMTTRGEASVLKWVFRGIALPGNMYLALVTNAIPPTRAMKTLSELTEIVAGNGYTTGGYQLDLNTTDFETLSEDDVNDWAQLLMKDIIWTASGGPIPDSGDGARWAVLTTDEGTVANRQILAFWDLGGNISVDDGDPLTLADTGIRLSDCEA